MAGVKKDDVREHRIDMEVVADAYNAEERAMGLYYFLEEKLAFPFQARYIAERRSSPVQRGEVVEVRGMTREEDCEHDMLGDVQWEELRLGVPLSQLEGIGIDEA